MKKNKSTYLGKFKLSKTNLEPDGKLSCELQGFDDLTLTIRIGDVKQSIKDLDYAEAWHEGQHMLIELVMKSGKRFQNWVKGAPNTLH